MKLKNPKNISPEIKVTKIGGGGQEIEHADLHKDLEWLKKVVYIGPGLLKNRRIKYVIENNYPSPSGEYNLWFTERYYNGNLHDVIRIKLNDLIVDPNPGRPTEGEVKPYDDGQLVLARDVDCYSHQEDDQIKNHYLSFNNNEFLSNKRGYRAEEHGANREDYLRKERGADVRNGHDGDQSHNPTTYGFFYMGIKDTPLYYYIVPIYWELATMVKKKSLEEGTII